MSKREAYRPFLLLRSTAVFDQCYHLTAFRKKTAFPIYNNMLSLYIHIG